jgi:hypothetical protein
VEVANDISNASQAQAQVKDALVLVIVHAQTL